MTHSDFPMWVIEQIHFLCRNILQDGISNRSNGQILGLFDNAVNEEE